MPVAEKILSHLARPRTREYPPTGREIADAVGASPGAVTTALKKLAADGRVTRLGVGATGRSTWGLAEDMA